MRWEIGGGQLNNSQISAHKYSRKTSSSLPLCIKKPQNQTTQWNIRILLNQSEIYLMQVLSFSLFQQLLAYICGTTFCGTCTFYFSLALTGKTSDPARTHNCHTADTSALFRPQVTNYKRFLSICPMEIDSKHSSIYWDFVCSCLTGNKLLIYFCI